MDAHPDEYVITYKSEKSLPGVDDLIEKLYEPKKLEKNANLWPLLTALILLCPERMNGLGNSLLKNNDIAVVCCIETVYSLRF